MYEEGRKLKNEISAVGFIRGYRDEDDEKEREVGNIFAHYSPILKPNRKPTTEILEYIKSKYPTVENTSCNAKRKVEFTVLNSFYKGKSPGEIPLEITVLDIRNEGAGLALYDLQKQEYMELVEKRIFTSSFESRPIQIGAEHITGYMFVEASQALSDEIVIVRGLGEEELQNKYEVANYVRILKKCKMIE